LGPSGEFPVATKNSDIDSSTDQTARMNRERLTIPQRSDDGLQEAVKKAMAVRENMSRLRELRLAREAQEARTEISAGNQDAKAKPKRRFR
jgi:hypothetical protein